MNTVVTIVDGQASATVPGPLHDGDTASFVVPKVNPWDVVYPGTLTSTALTAFIKAHPGQKIGIGPATLNATLELRQVSGTLVLMGDIRTTVDASPGAFHFVGCTLTLDLDDWRITGPIKLADFAGKANNFEQHHGIRDDGGHVTIQHGTVSGFWGDCISYRAWDPKNGGDGKAPLATMLDLALTLGGRCGWSFIQAASGSSATLVNTDQTGAWGADLETNSGPDIIGAVVITGGTIGSHGLGKNPTWTSDGIISAIQISCNKSSKPAGPVTIQNVDGDQLDIIAKHVSILTLDTLTSKNPARLFTENVGKVVKSGLVNIT